MRARKGSTASDAPPDTDDRLDDLADDLAALASPHRLHLLHFITRPRYGEELAEALGMSRQSALKHVERLRERGFVRQLNGRRETGPVVEFQVVPQRLFALGVQLSHLGTLEQRGGPEVQHRDDTVVLDKAGRQVQDAPPAPRTTGHLLILDGPNAGDRFVLDDSEYRWTIGRDEDRDLSLCHDPYVSGHHAEIQVSAAGLVLVDQHSVNGTKVNFASVPRGGRVQLSAGDVIGIGHTRLALQLVAPPPADPTGPTA